MADTVAGYEFRVTLFTLSVSLICFTHFHADNFCLRLDVRMTTLYRIFIFLKLLQTLFIISLQEAGFIIL